jgi:amino acid adenylation domain-containing protein
MNPPDNAYRALLHDGLERAARCWPDKPAVHAGSEHCSYRALDAAAGQLAAGLQARGLCRGDRVAIFMDNTVSCVIAIYAVLRAGGVFVVINPQTRQNKLCFIANDCGIRHLLTDISLAGVARTVLGTVPSLSHLLVSGHAADLRVLCGPGVQTEWLPEVIAASPPAPREPGTIPSDLAALIYTSGSTGNPKGVMHTHQSMVFALGSLTEYQRLDASDVLLNVLPMAFDYGLYQLLLAVAVGATLVLERSFTFPAEVYGHMHEHGVTTFPGVPTVFAMMIASHRRNPLRFPSIKRVTNTAAALPPAYIPLLRDIFPNALVFSMYGLTECKRVSYLPPGLLDAKPGSVGIAIPGTEVYLRTPDGRLVPPGEPGMLYVRGPHLMRGYWNDPEQTSRMLVPGDLPGETVLCTGDWFRMDEDGCLYFLSRSDDIIKSRGEKISPAEVEAALCAVAGVREAAVIGVEDAVLGQAIRAFVVPVEGVTLDERYLRHELFARLENFMMPRDILLRDTLPRTANGKVDRRALA